MIDIGLAQRLPDQARRKIRLLDGLAMSADGAAEAAARQLNKLDGDDPIGERLQRTVEEQERRRAELFELTGACKRWLRSLPDGVELELVEADPPPREQDESAERAVGKLRARIGQLSAERMRVERARLPKEAIRQELRASVAKLAALGRPRLRIERGHAEAVFGDPGGVLEADVRWVAGLVCWLDPDRVAERLDALVDELPDGLALAPAEREARLAELDTEIEALERSEEALISHAYGANVDLLRRAAASPAAVLGVRIAARPARRPRPAGPFAERQSIEAAQ